MTDNILHFGRVIEPRKLAKTSEAGSLVRENSGSSGLSEQNFAANLSEAYAETLQAEHVDADKAFADAIYAWMRDRLPFAICWFCAGMLAVILPVLVIERVLS